MEQKLLPASKKINTESLLGNKKGKSSGGIMVSKMKLIQINSRTVKIEKLLGRENKRLKSEIKKIRVSSEKQTRTKRETRLETKDKKDKEKGGKKGMSLPGGGLFDGVKKFINGILIGYVALRLLPYLPKLLEILPALVAVGDFLVDGIIGLLDGIGNFLNGAYELRDKTIGFIDKIGGAGAVDAFLQFEGALDKVLTALVGVGGIMMLASDKGGKGGGGKNAGKRGFDKTGRRVSKSAQKRFYERYGRDKFIERFGRDNLKNLPKSLQRSAGTKLARNAAVRLFGKSGTKVGLKVLKNFISPIVKRIPIIGGLIDFALNYFVFKEPLGRAAFAAIGTTIFGALGATAGSILPFGGTLVGGALGGLAGDIAGKWLYDTFFSGKKPVDVPSVDVPSVQGKEEVSATQSITPYVPKSAVDSDELTLFKRLVLAEAGGEGQLGMALVARSVLNRTGLIQTGKASLGTFLANSATVKGVIMGRGQYQPVSDGSINRERTAEQFEQASIAIELAQDPARLQRMLKSEGLSDSDIGKIISATGFRTGSAFNDPSQNVNVVKFKNHYFNTAGNPGVVVAQANIDTSTSAASVNIDTVDGGSREQSEGTKIAGDLGRFLYKELSSPRDFQAVTEHPDFGGSFRRSYDSYHNYDRAIDIGAYPHEQPKILEAIKKFNQINGVSPVELLHAGNDPKGDHDDHVHIAYHAGKRLNGKERIARILKNEAVLDPDTTKALGPTLLAKLDDASTPEGIMRVLQSAVGVSDFASYEQGAAQTIVVPMNQMQAPPQMGGSSGGIMPIAIPSAGEDFAEALAAGQ
jgi:hypothetical protein